MHIITYATAISMQPKQFICGIYHGTQTLKNLETNPHFVLQLLAADQYRLVDLLGKKSGSIVDKIDKLEKRKLLDEWKGFKILKNCLAVMEMTIISTLNTSGKIRGDHEIFLCNLISYKNTSEGDPLTLNILRDHKTIRI